MGERELVGNIAAAAHVGVSASAWRGYVARKQAPAPLRRQVEGAIAHPVWTVAQLDAWKGARKGRGAPGYPRNRTRPNAGP
jgi:hypothetical protein